MSVSLSLCFDSQINTVLFITLHQHTPWERTGALLDHSSGMQQLEWTCSNAQPLPASDAQGLSATLIRQHAWKSWLVSSLHVAPLVGFHMCPLLLLVKIALPVFGGYSTVPHRKRVRRRTNGLKVRLGTFLLLLKTHLCWRTRSVKWG